ncbi:hypothetical protein FNH22_17320 [Fulvivirga sp. M361]|uniref:hypothetical protein n=1 Tax=Fulvivirga sp. M361 TaxID=2594266 RepID=UPI00117AE2EE|nr:hypothetical protein [Fulvivirga sp. M361]TRX56138.1 hypothetical protein FNH22_17320 [Fulvivirga sp. M361]
MRLSIIILLLANLLSSCGTGADIELSISEYRKWLTSSENGLRKHKKGKLIDVSASFLPSDLLTYRELNASLAAYSGEMLDSIKTRYDNTLNFTIELSAKQVGENLLWYGLTDYTSYQARIHKLNFNIENFISLKIMDATYYPVLSHFEGYNELSNKLIFHIAFAPTKVSLELPGTTVRLTFDDPYWRTGVNHFSFKKEDFDNIPELVIE